MASRLPYARLAASVCLGCSSLGCSSSAGPGSNANGGELPTGGSPGSGGISAGAGGDSASGGLGNSGGASSSGGQTASDDVLLEATFNARSAGPYTEDLVAGDFGAAPAWNNGLDEGRATIVVGEEDPFLRVTYPPGQYGPAEGGVQFIIPLGDSFQELYLSYRVRFGTGFEFVKGGKLPGLVGGSAPTGCVVDETGFSARMMWRTGGLAVQYLYFPDKIASCGDDYDYQVGGADALFTPGEWHVVLHRIVMNAPGESNGAMQAWFDGELALDNQSFVWRKTPADWAIDALYFSTFFGGSDATWAPSTDQTIDYDDFVVSTGRIEQ